MQVLAFSVLCDHVVGHNLLDFQFLLAFLSSSVIHLPEDSLDLVDVSVLLELRLIEDSVRAGRSYAPGSAGVALIVTRHLTTHLKHATVASLVLASF